MLRRFSLVRGCFIGLSSLLFVMSLCAAGPGLQVSPKETLETHGLTVLLFHNAYHKVFGDQKMSGLEIILHERRIATNGDVRLSAVPAQWDAIPDFEERKRGPAENTLTASCSYPKQGLAYRIEVQPELGGF